MTTTVLSRPRAARCRIIAPRAGRARSFVIENVSWRFYEQTLREMQASHNHLRITYDDGRMEFMTLGGEHERTKKTIARLIEIYALERDIPITGVGSVTCRRKRLRKGLEPDECYYVATPAPPMDRSQLDLNRFPPPDLAIEVDITHGSIPRQPIYAALGVREVWRFDGRQIVPMRLTPQGRYEPIEASELLPGLPMAQLNRCIQIGLRKSQHEAVKTFRAWIQLNSR